MGIFEKGFERPSPIQEESIPIKLFLQIVQMAEMELAKEVDAGKSTKKVTTKPEACRFSRTWAAKARLLGVVLCFFCFCFATETV